MESKNFLAEFTTHCAHTEKDESCRSCDADALVLTRELWTMDDGVELEFCLWTEGDFYAYDLSVNKERFNQSPGGDFVAYLKSKGLPTENDPEILGSWRYAGIINKPDVYRVQFNILFDND